MIQNLAEYFLPNHEFYLRNISYNRIDEILGQKNYSLDCIDSIQVDANEDGVRVAVSRNLKFDPEGLFELSISFDAILKFIPDKKEEYNWHEINLAEEFRENGDFVTSNLMCRISLLISQITSSFGQQPIVLPPNVVK